MEVARAHLSGRLFDEHGLPPLSTTLTVIHAAERKGDLIFLRVGSDERLHPNGTFTSPLLAPGTYYVRFFGVLQEPPGIPPTRDPRELQKRCFDFIYPNANHVSRAMPFEFENNVDDLLIRIPNPQWVCVSGRVRGRSQDLPERLVVMWQRDIGIAGGVGAMGFSIGPDGTFSGPLLTGTYHASVHEMAPPEENGRTYSVRQLSPVITALIEEDLEALEIPLSTPDP
jgi:hypothetical protein